MEDREASRGPRLTAVALLTDDRGWCIIYINVTALARRGARSRPACHPSKNRRAEDGSLRKKCNDTICSLIV